MNFLNIFKNKVICIPLLQRDYVQGGKESVISPFIDSLLDESNPSDLNYIYGYTEHGSFIPVDGQQRLTTLWLLYLYVAAKAGMMSDFTVNLTFLSREYAGDFCERLKCKMPEVLQKATEDNNLNSIIFIESVQVKRLKHYGNIFCLKMELLLLFLICQKRTGLMMIFILK